MIESSLDPLVTISADGKITDVNEATIKVTGIPREQLIGTDFSNYFTEPEKAREGYQQVFARGYVTDYPLTIRHRDGRLTDVLYNASVYRDVLGNVLGVFAAARDVTQSKSVMRDFAETKNFLDNILQSSTKYSIIGKDLNHRILSWNEGARRNYGYTAEQIMGLDSSVLHAPEDVASGAVDKLLKTAYDKGLAESSNTRPGSANDPVTSAVGQGKPYSTALRLVVRTENLAGLRPWNAQKRAPAAGAATEAAGARSLQDLHGQAGRLRGPHAAGQRRDPQASGADGEEDNG